jgi:hypothetical protein
LPLSSALGATAFVDVTLQELRRGVGEGPSAWHLAPRGNNGNARGSFAFAEVFPGWSRCGARRDTRVPEDVAHERRRNVDPQLAQLTDDPRAFDDVFRSEGVEIILTLFRAPNANASAERFVGTVRRDCLDWLLIARRRQLERVLRVYVDHYNRHRPHRALELTARIPGWRPRLVSSRPPVQIHRRDRLGGLIHEYVRAP